MFLSKALLRHSARPSVSNRIPKSATDSRDFVIPRIWVGNIKWTTGKAQLTEYFNRFGAVRDVRMFFDNYNGLHKGFAFVTFEEINSVSKVLETAHDHALDNQQIRVKLAQSQEDDLAKRKFNFDI
uniref:RRM domain-containing protein n=1 Tax=Plectus sambesii TaxID=2011161 RepID=A0A914WVY1_9BILA